MHEALDTYPGFPAFVVQAKKLDSSVAFYAGDYTAMLELSESLWTDYPTYDSAAGLANAYACVYASTGDEAAKLKALEMLAKAKDMASTPDARKDLQEYEPRFNHRLETRKILTREQYNEMVQSQ
jgi:hypothetical protein